MWINHDFSSPLTHFFFVSCNITLFTKYKVSIPMYQRDKYYLVAGARASHPRRCESCAVQINLFKFISSGATLMSVCVSVTLSYSRIRMKDISVLILIQMIYLPCVTPIKLESDHQTHSIPGNILIDRLYSDILTGLKFT